MDYGTPSFIHLLSHRFHGFLFLGILLISRNTLIINIVLDIT